MGILSIIRDFFYSQPIVTKEDFVAATSKKPKTKITYPKSDPMYYFQLARQQFETDQPFEQAIKKYHEMRLKGIKSNYNKKVKVSCVSACCEQCSDLNNKIFKIEDALRLNPLPCSWCKNEYNEKLKRGWCRCLYFAHS